MVAESYGKCPAFSSQSVSEPQNIRWSSNKAACGTYRLTLLYSAYTLAFTKSSPSSTSASTDQYCVDSSPTQLTFIDPPARNNDVVPQRLIFNPSFSASDRVLNFFRPGSPIHNWYTNSTSASSSSSGPIHPNLAYVTLDPEDIPQPFQIGIPFHGSHTPSISVSYSNTPMCRSSYLALGHCTATYTPLNPGGGNMFIVTADHDTAPTSCTHNINLDAGRRNSPWRALALLAGYRQGTSSLGTVVAVSSRATDIAAASWSDVLVWSLDPSLLLQGNLETYFPPCDWNQGKELGRLRPVKLRNQGVVYSMLWVGETSLYAVTDGGLVRWDVSAPGSRGEVETGLSL